MLPVHPRLAGRVDSLVDLHDAAFAGGGRAFVLLVQRARKHDVGMVGGLGQEEVDHGVELELVERLGGEPGVGCRHGGVEADRQQALDLPGVDRLDDLLGGDPLARDLVLGAPPHRRDVGAVLRVGDVPIARELIALVAVLPPALAVALPGDRRHAAAGLAVLAGGEAEVDGGEHVLRALALLFDPAGVQQHAGGRGAPPLRRLGDARRRHPGDPGRPLRRHRRHCGRRGVEVVRVVGDEVVVEPPVLDELVQHGAEQRRVGSRTHRQEQVGGASQRHDPWVLDDQARTPVAGPPDVARRDRERLGHVRPCDPDHVGERDVAPRVGVAVDAQRLLVARPRRHHAEAAVVVEVGRVQGEAGELADEVALLVGQRDPREHGEGIVAVGGLDAPDLADDAIESGVPVGGAETTWCRRVPLHRVQQPVGVAALEVPLDALRAELALVERELVPRLEPDDRVVPHLQLDAALLAAEAAVRVDDAVDLEPMVPATGGRLVEVRSVPGDEVVLAHRPASHQPKPPTRDDWASVTRARRQRGQVSW